MKEKQIQIVIDNNFTTTSTLKKGGILTQEFMKQKNSLCETAVMNVHYFFFLHRIKLSDKFFFCRQLTKKQEVEYVLRKK